MSRGLATVRRDPKLSALDWILSVVHAPGVRPALPNRLLCDPIVRIDRVEHDVTTVVIDDLAISIGKVALIRSEDGRYCIEDEGSTNPVRVNGQRLRGPRALDANDVIRIGESVLVIDRADVARPKSPRRAPDQLLDALHMYDSTEAAIFAADRLMFDVDAQCVGIECEGFLEARAVAAWFAVEVNQQTVRIDGADPNLAHLISEAAASSLLFVERIDTAAPEAASKAVAAIERRIAAGGDGCTLFSYAGTQPSGTPLARLVETHAEDRLRVGALRERRADVVPAIVRTIESDGELAWSPRNADCIERLLCYTWPAGVAELNRVATRFRRVLLDGRTIGLAELPTVVRSIPITPDQHQTRELTPESFARVFEELGRNMTETAAHYGYARTYFYRLLRKRGIDVPGLRQTSETVSVSSDVPIDRLRPGPRTPKRDE